MKRPRLKYKRVKGRNRGSIRKREPEPKHMIITRQEYTYSEEGATSKIYVETDTL